MTIVADSLAFSKVIWISSTAEFNPHFAETRWNRVRMILFGEWLSQIVEKQLVSD